MRMMRSFILTFASVIGLTMLLGLTMTSCIDDAVTTSSSATLTFSRDTVNFDTVFTDLGTPTARLIVRNKNKKGVNISSIKFKRADSEFSLNVDGMSGTEFHDVEIRGRDSIFLFIECFIPESQGASPGLTADELEFVTNGVTQHVRVEAYGQNVTRLRAQTLTSDMTLTADQPYVIFDSLRVEPGVTLRIEPGAQILFHDGARLSVEGTLIAQGTPGKMIQMRGDRLDNVLPNVGYDIMSGQWEGIRIGRESYDNRIEYVDMRSTVSGLTVQPGEDTSRRKLTLVNSWLHNSKWNVLTAYHSKVDAYGCCFSEASNSVVSLIGGEHMFDQCTFANNYLFSAITGSMLELSHLFPKDLESISDEENPDSKYPLMKASIENSIIYGLGAELNVDDLTDSQVYLRYVSLGVNGSDDDNFINCLWDSDPLFYTDRPIYYFNYRLQEDSPVKSAGDAALVNELTRCDMDGTDRLSSGAPSLGAYQYTAPKTN